MGCNIYFPLLNLIELADSPEMTTYTTFRVSPSKSICDIYFHKANTYHSELISCASIFSVV